MADQGTRRWAGALLPGCVRIADDGAGGVTRDGERGADAWMQDPSLTERLDDAADGWPLRSSLEFGPLPSAVSCARLHARELLWEWGLTGLSEGTELVVSELVTNGIRASGAESHPGPVRLMLLSDGTRVLILVWDASLRPPVRMDACDDAENGRGMVLVETFSAQWDWYYPPDAGGKVVWALIQAEPDGIGVPPGPRKAGRQDLTGHHDPYLASMGNYVRTVCDDLCTEAFYEGAVAARLPRARQPASPGNARVMADGAACSPCGTAERYPGLVVAGFPTRDEAPTIGQVVAVADEGLGHAGLSAATVLVNADNDSPDGTAAVFLGCPARSRRVTVATGARGTGKGTNLLAIFHAALDLGAERLVVLDGDVCSGEPWWVTRLLGAVDCDGPAVAVPVYRRNRYEGNTTNHLASPLLAAVLGVDVQQPIAGDFAFNRAFIERAVTWPLPESAQLYGIDIWLTGNAAREGHRITQVPLGRKIHNPGFPKIVKISQQVIDALWHVIYLSGALRPPGLPQVPARSTVDQAAVCPDAGLTGRAFARVSRYLAANADAITEVFPCLAGAVPGRDGLVGMPAALWAEVLGDALAALAAGRAAEARDHLVALYLCRVAAYWQEIERLQAADAIDALLDEQSALVSAAVSRRGLRFTARPPMDFRPGPWAEGA